MNEEFAIALKLALDESSIQNVKKRLDKLKEELKTTIDINVEAKKAGESVKSAFSNVDASGIKEYSAQIELAEQECEQLRSVIDNLTHSGGEVEEIIKFNAELEKAENKLISLRQKQNGLTDATKKTSVAVKSLSFSNFASSIKDAVKSAKIFTLALIGARSVYIGIRKAMSSYLAQNDALQQKLNACWYALGSLFAPVLEKIISLFATLIGYVNVFLKALGFAGINMSGFASSASSGASSTKKIAKNLSGFDELNNIGDTSNSGSGGASVPDYSGMFDGSNLDTTWVGRIQAFGEWCKENIPIVAGLLSGVVTTIGLLKAGVEGIKALGIGLAVGGIVGSIVSLIEYLKDPSWDSFGGIITGIGVALGGLALTFGSVPLAVAAAIATILGLFAKFKDEINNFILKIENGIDNFGNKINNWLTSSESKWTDWLLNAIIQTGLSWIKAGIGQIRLWLNGAVAMLRSVVDGIIQICNGNLWGGIKTIFNGIGTFLKGVWDGWVALFKGTIGKLIEEISKFGSKVLSGIKTWFSNLANTVSSWFKRIINNYIISPINNVIRWLNEKLHFSYSGLRILGKQVIPSFDVQLANLGTLPSLNVGTNYVPNDTLAQLHQGEAVIPKRFNSKEYFNGNSDETNSLLQTLINKVDSIELNPYITVKDVGKASIKYINQQSRIIGNNLI